MFEFHEIFLSEIATANTILTAILCNNHKVLILD